MREKVLRDEITVVEVSKRVPKSVEELEKEMRKGTEKLMELRKKDKAVALRRLHMLKNQIAKKDGS